MIVSDPIGKLAVITGAQRGVCRAMARTPAETGADVNGCSGALEESGSNAQQDIVIHIQSLHGDPPGSTTAPERIPADRWRGAGDPAGATVFLASHAAAYVPGVVPPVNRGRLGR
ncbi:hypothetical protein ACIG56_21415 [Nocardia fusca]|uniref:hypothetical protein n=1 Tax=Nocardia fusca TaxID=941183 RepID=UPI0037CB9C80